MLAPDGSLLPPPIPFFPEHEGYWEYQAQQEAEERQRQQQQQQQQEAESWGENYGEQESEQESEQEWRFTSEEKEQTLLERQKLEDDLSQFEEQQAFEMFLERTLDAGGIGAAVFVNCTPAKHDYDLAFSQWYANQICLILMYPVRADGCASGSSPELWNQNKVVEASWDRVRRDFYERSKLDPTLPMPVFVPDGLYAYSPPPAGPANLQMFDPWLIREDLDVDNLAPVELVNFVLRMVKSMDIKHSHLIQGVWFAMRFGVHPSAGDKGAGLRRHLNEWHRFHDDRHAVSKRVAMLGLLFASKWLDDNAFATSSYSDVTGIWVPQIRQMERAILKDMFHSVYVPVESWKAHLDMCLYASSTKPDRKPYEFLVHYGIEKQVEALAKLEAKALQARAYYYPFRTWSLYHPPDDAQAWPHTLAQRRSVDSVVWDRPLQRPLVDEQAWPQAAVAPHRYLSVSPNLGVSSSSGSGPTPTRPLTPSGPVYPAQRWSPTPVRQDRSRAAELSFEAIVAPPEMLPPPPCRILARSSFDRDIEVRTRITPYNSDFAPSQHAQPAPRQYSDRLQAPHIAGRAPRPTLEPYDPAPNGFPTPAEELAVQDDMIDWYCESLLKYRQPRNAWELIVELPLHLQKRAADRAGLLSLYPRSQPALRPLPHQPPYPPLYAKVTWVSGHSGYADPPPVLTSQRVAL